MDIINQLRELAKLKAEGIIDEEEFKSYKNQLRFNVNPFPSVPLPLAQSSKPLESIPDDNSEYQSCDDFSDTSSITSEIPEPKHLLNYAPCQFPESKTQALIQKMQMTDKSKTRQLFFIYINNNTAEASQLKGRLDKVFNKKRVFNICSRSILKNPFEKLKTSLRINKTKETFPLAIIACPTDKGKKEFNKIIQIIYNLETTIVTHLVIDEADKNLEVIKYALNINHAFASHQYITATPTSKMIKDIGVDSLEHLNTQLPGNNFSEAFDKYHKIEDNEVHFIDGELDLVSFAKAVLDKISLQILFTDNLRIFCPGEINRASHKQLCKLFEAEFNILIFNTEKYFLVKGQRIEYTKFAKTVENNSEISNVLGAFTQQYPGHFVIIGNSCIARGITFNSGDTFNFTDAIYHPGISQQREKTEQLMSRSCGNKDYCKPHRIYVSKPEYDEILLQVHGKTRLLKLSPDNFNSNDFRKYKAKDMDVDYIILPNWESVKRYGDIAKHAHPTLFNGFDTRNRCAETKINGKHVLNDKPMAADTYCKDNSWKQNGNPSIYHVLRHLPPLGSQNASKGSTIRAIPLNDYRWMVVWRPSFFPTPLPKMLTNVQ